MDRKNSASSAVPHSPSIMPYRPSRCGMVCSSVNQIRSFSRGSFAASVVTSEYGTTANSAMESIAIKASADSRCSTKYSSRFVTGSSVAGNFRR